MNKAGKFLQAVLLAIFILPQFAAAQTVVVPCINLTSDVSAGMTDAITNGPILELQNFLVAQGFLSATPNGHFGPATLAAVTAFQSTNGISATGYVGPITRGFIENKTCSSTSANTTANTSASVAPVNTPPMSTLSPQSFAVTAPSSNQTLTLGNDYTIQWSGNPGYNYTIILENQNGLGQGIIASSLSTGNQYVWQVGQIFSPGGTGYQTVSSGTYQIHIETASGQDMYSGLFTINAPAITINSIVPASAPADGKTAVVLFGSGFVNPTNVYINGSYGANVLFTSADGKVIVFSVPINVPAGSQSLYVSNEYGSYSNGEGIMVTSPTAQ
ncbi:MAG TPA: peptidoglycan-binding protein [Candidatus Paceibacterota bacterium]|nr:peptidoglycan-binding protein [Candidatus Paceibacterota bacterium]